MKLGAEPKKIAILGTLLAVGGGAFYFNVIATDEQPAPRPAPAAATATAAPSAPATAAPKPVQQTRPDGSGRPVAGRPSGKAAVNEFRPRMGSATPEDRPDPASVDPALHLDLLAKLQTITPPAAGRNLFQYGTTPPPPAAAVQPMPVVPKIPVNQAPAVAPAPPGPAPPPPPTPANFKYYGFKTARLTGVKHAFLLDGEEIIIVAENEVVKKRYRVVRIAVGSIVVEDMQGQGQQTITIEGQPAA